MGAARWSAPWELPVPWCPVGVRLPWGYRGVQCRRSSHRNGGRRFWQHRALGSRSLTMPHGASPWAEAGAERGRSVQPQRAAAVERPPAQACSPVRAASAAGATRLSASRCRPQQAPVRDRPARRNRRLRAESARAAGVAGCRRFQVAKSRPAGAGCGLRAAAGSAAGGGRRVAPVPPLVPFAAA